MGLIDGFHKAKKIWNLGFRALPTAFPSMDGWRIRRVARTRFTIYPPTLLDNSYSLSVTRESAGLKFYRVVFAINTLNWHIKIDIA